MSKRTGDEIENEFRKGSGARKQSDDDISEAQKANLNKENKEDNDSDMGEFEDMYEDEFESDEEIIEAGGSEDDENDEDEDENENNKNTNLSTINELEGENDKDKNLKKSNTLGKKNERNIYLPNMETLGENEVLEPDPSAYHMLHRINMPWPCLSLDILPDSLGDQRRSYPATIYFTTGTQAEKSKDNEIIVCKLSSLSKTYEHDDDDEDSDSDNEDTDDTPVIENSVLPAHSTTNRIRVTPFASPVTASGEYLTASMAESGDVHIWDLTPQMKSFDTPGTVISKQQKRPIYTITAHGGVEGYAVDWNPCIRTGNLLTGDIIGRIHNTTRGQSSWITEKKPYLASEGITNASVEELQWSPVEKSVFASGSADGLIRIWDTRSPKHSFALQVKASESDVNVMNWSKKVNFLLASGHDDGSWSVWDLRSFKPEKAVGGVLSPTPVASYDFHKKPITSIEFHPDEDSVLAVSSEDSTVTLWDLAVEEDNDTSTNELKDIPPQLLFVHWQRNVKEVHWHKQIPGVLLSTGSDGLSVWKSISI